MNEVGAVEEDDQEAEGAEGVEVWEAEAWEAQVVALGVQVQEAQG